jgi:UDP-glucose 4-epimerase
MKALVTGGAGFIGSHLVEALEANGWRTTAVDNLSAGLASNLPGSARLIAADVGDDRLLDEILPGTNALFHLAAVSSVQDALDCPLAVHEVNLTMTLRLLEAAVRHKVKRFVFSSSAAIYGDTEGKPAKEDMVPRPLSHYAVQKLACEHYCQEYWRLHGLETVCLRYFNVYGPRQRPDSPYSGVISRFVDAAGHGKSVTIFGDGNQTRDFVNVSDVARANLMAATSPSDKVAGEVFNVGTGTSTTVKDLAKAVIQHSEANTDIIHKDARLGEIKYSRADVQRIRDQLGFSPRVAFQAGLAQLVASTRA